MACPGPRSSQRQEPRGLRHEPGATRSRLVARDGVEPDVVSVALISEPWRVKWHRRLSRGRAQQEWRPMDRRSCLGRRHSLPWQNRAPWHRLETLNSSGSRWQQRVAGKPGRRTSLSDLHRRGKSLPNEHRCGSQSSHPLPSRKVQLCRLPAPRPGLRRPTKEQESADPCRVIPFAFRESAALTRLTYSNNHRHCADD